MGALRVTLTLSAHALFLLCTDVTLFSLEVCFHLVEGWMFKWPQKGKVRMLSVHLSFLRLLLGVTAGFDGEIYLLQ